MFRLCRIIACLTAVSLEVTGHRVQVIPGFARAPAAGITGHIHTPSRSARDGLPTPRSSPSAAVKARDFKTDVVRRVHAEDKLAPDGSAMSSRSMLLRGMAAGVASMLPARTLAKSFEEAEQAMRTYGLADVTLEKPPFGWKSVVEPIGLYNDADYSRRKLGSEPQILAFNVPALWVVTKPNVDYNGAAGTLQANDYNKGDSATFFVDVNFKGTLKDMKKNDFEDELFKALSLKGKNLVDELKVTKIYDGAPGYRNIDYVYTVESGAGFSLNRIGKASVTQAGVNGYLQLFWTTTTTPRWDSAKDTLAQMVSSFRIADVPKDITVDKREFKAKGEA